LLDKNNKEAYFEEITDEYDDIREDHYENLRDRKYLTIEQAREKKLKIDWNSYSPRKNFEFLSVRL